MGIGRFLNRALFHGEGIWANESSAIVREDDNSWSAVGGMRFGATGNPITFITSVLGSLDFAAIQPAGSTGAQSVDVALDGAAPGDLCWAAPVQSVPLGVVAFAACYSAGAVNVRVVHTQSGNIDLAPTNWRVVAMRFG